MPTNAAPDGETLRSPAGLYLLFERGYRPQRSDVLAALAAIAHVSVSHDPAASLADGSKEDGTANGDTGNWLELLNSGMTFDLLGLAPGPSLGTPEIAHRLACGADMDLTELEAVALVAGPHLADGANSLPIVRAMLEVGCGLACALDKAGILCWSPARAAMGRQMFCRSVEKWLEGGPLPGLGLTAFKIDESGLLASEGLAYFAGQELRFSRELSQDRIAATRLGVRLVHEIVGSGRVTEPREFVTETGTRLLLHPDDERSQIEVLRM